MKNIKVKFEIKPNKVIMWILVVLLTQIFHENIMLRAVRTENVDLILSTVIYVGIIQIVYRKTMWR